MTGRIFINGEIGRDTTPKSVRAQLNLAYTNYEIIFNSYGGDVYDGYEIGGIINEIRQSGKQVLGLIRGECASIATYIACCCDKLLMSPHGDFTIHDPTASINGGAKDFRQAAERLDRIKSEIIDRYLSKIAPKGKTAEQLSQAMEVETSMSPEQAAEWGFVDEIEPRMKAVAKLDLTKFAMEKDKSMLEALSAKVTSMFQALRKVSYKNMTEETLEDGTTIVIMAMPDEDWIGKQVTAADGSPLQPGDYKTKSGKAFKVADGGLIAEAAAAEAPENKDMENVDQLKNKIAELEAALATKDTAAKESEAAVASLKTQFMNISKELEEVKKTVGHDTNIPVQGMKFPDLGKSDPMGEAIIAELKARRGA
jgi:ATP-dependent protease ClpP protease subunit